MKKIIGLITVLLIFSIFSFAQKKGAGTVQRYTPKFDYVPKTRDSVAKNNIVILLMQPIFIQRDIKSAGTPWNDFATSMGNDLEELITAKGFVIKGDIINSYDEMVYSDKANSDIIITAEIDFHALDDRKTKSVFSLSSVDYFKIVQGDVGITVSVVLSAISPITKQKLWKKNLSLPVRSFTYEGSIKWPATPSVITEMNQDVNLWNPMCKNLEDIYQESMNTIWRQFDPDELKDISIEAKKADGKIKG